MKDFQTISNNLIKNLQLQYKPAGVSLYKESDLLPERTSFTAKELKSYCQAVILAGEGETLLLAKEKMGCKLGTSVLGFEQEMDAFLDDGVLEKYGVGLFGTEEASAETILKSTYLEKGATRAAFIAPLTAFNETPQVVVFTANSEQIMWLLYAINYEKGGKLDLPQSGGALGGCSDITALPMITGQPNITFLGLGCRMKSSIDPCHLMMGINGNDLEKVHKHVQNMAKPIAMLNKQSSGS
ncbi:MAG: DUF169 domain-containing protein [Deltaproteobacteria bacterium]|nr:DUF169 domain-containing protein [Deltaproteobacteria bacterium]